VLANEVSDHLHIYMWGGVARELLRLPGEGFAIATSCHADTIRDVLSMLRRDLRVPAETVRTLGLVVNIGVVGRVWPPRRRFLTTHFILPEGGEDEQWGARLLPLSTWREASDDFAHADQAALVELAGALRMEPDALVNALHLREERMAELAAGRGASIHATRRWVESLWAMERGEPEDEADGDIDGAAE
jgi:hypothetical protein